jgi:hypothetical protein
MIAVTQPAERVLVAMTVNGAEQRREVPDPLRDEGRGVRPPRGRLPPYRPQPCPHGRRGRDMAEVHRLPSR